MRMQQRSLPMLDLRQPLHGRIDQEEDSLLCQLNSKPLETWTKLLYTMRSDTDILLILYVTFVIQSLILSIMDVEIYLFEMKL